MSKYRVSIKSPTIVASRFVCWKQFSRLSSAIKHVLPSLRQISPLENTLKQSLPPVNQSENRFVHYDSFLPLLEAS